MEPEGNHLGGGSAILRSGQCSKTLKTLVLMASSQRNDPPPFGRPMKFRHQFLKIEGFQAPARQFVNLAGTWSGGTIKGQTRVSPFLGTISWLASKKHHGDNDQILGSPTKTYSRCCYLGMRWEEPLFTSRPMDAGLLRLRLPFLSPSKFKTLTSFHTQTLLESLCRNHVFLSQESFLFAVFLTTDFVFVHPRACIFHL